MSFIQNISTFRAFRNRNYALYFGGQSVSLIGTWMQRTSVSWVIYTMTHSEFMLGVTIFASQFPSFLLSLYGGIISDRYNRYRIILITQTAAMVQAIMLAILTLTNSATVWEILLLSVLLGIINAFDVPARQPMVNEMLQDKNDLPNAIALNSSMVNLARIIGPGLSGIILAKYGAGICFLSNAVSFVAVLTSLLMMKLPSYTPHTTEKNAISELKEGMQYIRQAPTIGFAILMIGCMSLLVLPYETLLPVFAKEIFKGNAATFGYIRSFIGLGAIGGTIFLASLKGNTDLRKVLLVNTAIMGIGLLFFSHTASFPLAMLFAIIVGFGAMSQNTICNTLIQVNTAARMRGRIISFYTMSFFGMLPIGSLLVGSASEKIGSPNTLFIQGGIAILTALVFSRLLLRSKLIIKPVANKDHL